MAGMSDPRSAPGSGAGPGTSTVLERELEGDVATRPKLSHGDGDHERFAHYVRKEKILESALSGDAVRALCGKKWVPTRDPSRFPICPTCKDIYESLAEGPKDDNS
jgi:hypothetical protein